MYTNPHVNKNTTSFGLQLNAQTGAKIFLLMLDCSIDSSVEEEDLLYVYTSTVMQDIKYHKKVW